MNNQKPLFEGETIQLPNEKRQIDNNYRQQVHVKLQIQQREPHLKPGMNAGVQEG
jgi:hypothetical protein